MSFMDTIRSWFGKAEDKVHDHGHDHADHDHSHEEARSAAGGRDAAELGTRLNAVRAADDRRGAAAVRLAARSRPQGRHHFG